MMEEGGDRDISILLYNMRVCITLATSPPSLLPPGGIVTPVGCVAYYRRSWQGYVAHDIGSVAWRSGDACCTD